MGMETNFWQFHVYAAVFNLYSMVFRYFQSNHARCPFFTNGSSVCSDQFLGRYFNWVAISIYQRVNLVLHPADDLFQILRFRYFKGNATLSMWASYIPPTIMALLSLPRMGLANLVLERFLRCSSKAALLGLPIELSSLSSSIKP